ncbi:MAG: hypothetical protein WC763_01925 [Candidatus Paceibacterota bacterium]|jgi:hypothetical protein
MIAHDHNNIQPEEIQHIKGFLHQLKSEGFLLIENEGGDIYHEGFSSTPDRIDKFLSKDKQQDFTDLTKRTFEELEEIVRRNDNPDIKTSLHNRALLELELREKRSLRLLLKSDQNTTERGKTIKNRFKTDDVFLESRTQGDDHHFILGRRNGDTQKAHVIVDRENGSIRLEDGRQEPTEIVPLIETTITFADGRKVLSTRGILKETPTKNDDSVGLAIEFEKLELNPGSRTNDGVMDNFTITVHFLIKNHSSKKITLKNTYSSLQVPDGYTASQFGNSIKSQEDIAREDFISRTVQYSLSLAGRHSGGANSQNPIWEASKAKVLADIASLKFLLRLASESISLAGSSKIDMTFDITESILPNIKV